MWRSDPWYLQCRFLQLGNLDNIEWMLRSRLCSGGRHTAVSDAGTRFLMIQGEHAGAIFTLHNCVKYIIMNASAAVLMVSIVASALIAHADDSTNVIEAYFSRWRTGAPLRVELLCRPQSHVVAPGLDPFESANWKPRQDWRRVVTLRLHNGAYEADVQSAKGIAGPLKSYFSFVDEEFVELWPPTRAGSEAFAYIKEKADNDVTITEKFLTPLEQQFFDLYQPWPSVMQLFGFSLTGREEILGRECVKLENTLRTNEYLLTVWLDPTLNYAPVKATSRYVALEQPIEWEMRISEHLQVGDRWFAKSAVLVMSNPNVVKKKAVTQVDVTGISEGVEFTPQSLRRRFPAGTLVRDFIRMQKWRVDEDGDRYELEPIDPERWGQLARAAQARLREPEVRRTRNYAVIGIVSAAAAVAVLIVLAKRRA